MTWLNYPLSIFRTNLPKIFLRSSLRYVTTTDDTATTINAKRKNDIPELLFFFHFSGAVFMSPFSLDFSETYEPAHEIMVFIA